MKFKSNNQRKAVFATYNQLGYKRNTKKYGANADYYLSQKRKFLSKKQKVIEVKKVINYLKSNLGSVFPIQDIIKESKKRGITSVTTQKIVNQLTKIGDIYSPRDSLYQTIGGNLKEEIESEYELKY